MDFILIKKQNKSQLEKVTAFLKSIEMI